MVYIIESINIVVGNLIAIAVFTTNKKMRRRKYYLLINLAVADFLVGAVVVPWWTYDLAATFELWTTVEPTESTVAAAESIDLSTKYASLIGLMAVALERTYATLFPLRHRLVEAKTYYLVIASSWALSLIMPSIRAADIYELVPEDTFWFASLSFTILILLTIIASYVVIWVKVKFGHTPQNSRAAVRNRNLTVSLFLVTVISVVTWLPPSVTYAAYRILVDVSRSTPWSYESYIVVHSTAMILVFANSLVNPIVYSFRLPYFRQAASRFVCRYPEANEGHSRYSTARFSSKGGGSSI